MPTSTRLRATLAASAIAAIGMPAQAAVIFSDNFDNYSNADGFSSQADTGLQIGYAGDLAGWNAFGVNANHAVNRNGSGDWAPMFYGSSGGGTSGANGITMINGIAANASGTSYQVSFTGAGATYNSRSQANRDGDALLFRIIDAAENQVASFVYDPANWSDSASNPFISSGFSYVGTGSGLVRISILALTTYDHFGGAIDDLSVSSVAAAVPEPASAMLLLGGLGLLAARRRRAAR